VVALIHKISFSVCGREMVEHFFTTFVRTKSVVQQRLKDLKSYELVRVFLYEMQKLGVKGNVLYDLRVKGEIWYDDEGMFKVLIDGPLDFSLLQRARKWPKVRGVLSDLHLFMRQQLLDVTIDYPLDELPAYFKAFMLHRLDNLEEFFSVDGFSGRVHSPVVNLKGEYRKFLRLGGKSLCSLDVKQMQPTVLAKILHEEVGSNPFSVAIGEGKDVYLVLLEQNITLNTREDAKKFLYQLIFGKPMDDIGNMFRGDTAWVTWINSYKRRIEPMNPHGRETHTNLAWLLQSQEVKFMTLIWQRLMDASIPFLTIHDDVLVSKANKKFAYSVIEQELREHFKRFEIVVTCY
jgi:hypothetical protein